eukprot:CAMPEP_0117654604 /NCGR_PEP_ID=MMETSP0804-20121206/3832_1 /TAXON_ID=1074897 /ORGANISM="Tetraselmis astigmatica, Strain CCMP880" /LENGTH=300 /DNA_ID=CAMNT_0005460895 /DNA_START=212 /DNA_END=1111 /DNA_ORIENTATION=-
MVAAVAASAGTTGGGVSCCPSKVSAAKASDNPEGVAWALMQDGAVVVRGAVSQQGAAAALKHIDGALVRALAATGDRSMAPPSIAAQKDKAPSQMEAEIQWFGTVQAQGNRRDLKLQLCPAVKAALKEMLATVGGCLSELLTPDAVLCELSALCVDPGAAAQQLHPDTRIVPGQDQAGLITAFMALQDITPDMGPTEVLLRSHTAEVHQTLSASSISAASLALVQPVPLQAGDVLLMDSRLWHRGGANTSSQRRSLMYVTLKVPGNTPPGSTYSLLDEYCGRFRLRNYNKWKDASAEDEP